MALLVFFASILAFALAFLVIKATASKLPRDQWKSAPIPQQNSQDVVADTLKELDSVLDLLQSEAKEDSTLQKLIGQYKASSLSKEQLVNDYAPLKGRTADFIGMFHSGPGSNEEQLRDVDRIQEAVASEASAHYDFMWTEDFTGGNAKTLDTTWEELRDEFSSSLLPGMANDISKKTIQAYEGKMEPLPASYKLLRSAGNKVSVMAVDYRPIKAIQQHLMSYGMLYDLGKLPSKLDPKKMPRITQALSDARDLYALRYVAQGKHLDKRQVVVFGAFHFPHMARLMANFGVHGMCSVHAEALLDPTFKERERTWNVPIN